MAEKEAKRKKDEGEEWALLLLLLLLGSGAAAWFYLRRKGEDGNGNDDLAGSKYRTYGGASSESLPTYFFNACEDTNHIYAVGYTSGDVVEGRYVGAGLIVKFNKADLSIAARKIYSDTSGVKSTDFYAVCNDADYVYALGSTNAEGAGDINAVIVKFNKADLSVAAKKVYGSPLERSHFRYHVCCDSNYVYAIGGNIIGPTASKALIVKFRKSDLSIMTAKTYDGSGVQGTRFHGVCDDTSYVYAVGSTSREGTAGTALIVVFAKTDLSIVARECYAGPSNEAFYGCCVDAGCLYVVGWTASYGAGSRDAVIMKLNKASLGIIAQKLYGGAGKDYFRSVCQNGNYVYTVGYTDSEGQGNEDALVVKFNKGDLSIVAGRVCGGALNDHLNGVCADGSYVYAVGGTPSEGAYGPYFDAIIVKFDPLLSITSGVAPIMFNSSALTLANAPFSPTPSDLTLTHSTLTLANSGLSLNNSALALSQLKDVVGTI